MESTTTQTKKQPKQLFKEVFAFGEGITAEYAANILTVKGPAGQVQRTINVPFITLQVDNAQLILASTRTSSKEKKMMGTLKAHLNNMIKGVTNPHRYKLKVCSGHFPMTVTLSGNKLTVKNFFSEKVPREVIIPGDVKVEIKGSDLEVTSPDRESAGKCASSIEQLTRRTGFDRRIFQDGIYIVEKS